MAAFAEYQPQFAIHKIPVFPVEEETKKPCVKGYSKIGLPYSAKLVSRFPNASALGFCAGSYSGITVLDIDRSGKEGEKLLETRMERHGVSPFIVRTGSGNFHAYYRHNNEPKIIRHENESVDILGEGMVVAPPSKTSRGNYDIIHGEFDFLSNLPKLKNIDNNISRPSKNKVKDGNRNNVLWRLCMKQSIHCDSIDDLLDVARTHNDSEFENPLPNHEVVKVAKSAWGYQERGENWVGRKSENNIKLFLMTNNPDAFLVYEYVRYFNGGKEEFYVANAMKDTWGWPSERLSAARRFLIEHGFFLQLTLPKPGCPALFAWGSPSSPYIE